MEHGAAAGGGLITVEGIEGAGKSTQIAALRAWLEGLGVSCVATREPDGTALGAGVRRLLGGAPLLDPLAEALLFVAARAEHVSRVIRPALLRGAFVLCDRFADSTLAYQGYGRGVPLETIAGLNLTATGGLAPALTVILDLDVAEGLRRVGRRGSADPFERLGVEFHERVRKGYWAIRAREPERVTLLDAGRPVAQVAEEIRRLVAGRFSLGAGR